MTAHLMLESRNEALLRIVGDFAVGLGYPPDVPPEMNGRAIRIQIPESSEMLLDLVTHIALSATKTNEDLDEPVCHVLFRHANAAATVRLDLRIAEFHIDAAPSRDA